jgi:spore coat polysaccharide biosynthesis predicted glycosyltransferase SpsG
MKVLSKILVVIRVDSSKEIGMGHLTRCLSIAKFIRKKGVDVMFLTQEDGTHLQVVEKGYQSYKITKKELFDISQLPHYYDYFILIADFNSKSIFKNSACYFSNLDLIRKDFQMLVTLEELTDYPYCSDIVIIPYFGANKIKLRECSNVVYLLGEKYFLLRDEFCNNDFIVQKLAKNILITMGGGDPNRISLKVLSALFVLGKEYKFHVVLGQASDISDSELHHIMGNYKDCLVVYRNCSQMSEVMLCCDIAVTNSGLTKYELAALGVPTVVISNNASQSKIDKIFSEFQSSIYLGIWKKVKKDKILEVCKELLVDYGLRLKLSNNGKKLIGKKGLDGIWNAIIEKII